MRIVEEIVGFGPVAQRGDTVVFDLEISFNRGEILRHREEVSHRIGRRHLIAGVEKALEGMCERGYRKVRVSPHLAYGEGGVAGRIPPNAVLLCSIWVKRIGRGCSQGGVEA